VVTLLIAIISGITGGWLASREFLQPVHALFRDEDHIEDCMAKYPEDFIIGDCDEQYGHSFDDIKDSLKKLRAIFSGGDDEEAAMDKLVNKIWSECKNKSSVKTKYVKKFITAFVKTADHTMVVGNIAFDEIFGQEDMKKDKTKEDMANWLKEITE
jgi:hypothetical protein